jgi:hypothetical protein
MNNGIMPTVDLATNGGYNNSFFGGEGIWAIVLIALLFSGNNGFGWGGNNNVATTDFVSSEFTQRDISQLGTEVANGFTNTATNICNLRSDVLENRYAAQLSACNTQRDILTQTNELNTNLLTQALQNQAHVDSCCCEIKSLIREDGEQTRALITQNTIQDLRDRLQTAENVISNQSVVNQVRPYPVPSYIVSSPYQSIYNGFYGSNWYGNTIV